MDYRYNTANTTIEKAIELTKAQDKRVKRLVECRKDSKVRTIQDFRNAMHDKYIFDFLKEEFKHLNMNCTNIVIGYVMVPPPAISFAKYSLMNCFSSPKNINATQKEELDSESP